MPLLPAFGFSSYLRPLLVLSLISLGFLLSWTFLVDSTSSAGEEEWMAKSNFRVPSYLCKTIPSLCNSPPVASSAAILLARPSPSPAPLATYSASSTSRLLSSSAPFPTLVTPLSTSSMSSSHDGSTGSHMGDTLLSLKEMFLADLKAGSADGWTLVMGNEAGDLDSLSSSIAYAYLTRLLSPSSSSTTINPQKTLPLILSPLSSLALRPENILALQSALLLPKPTTASSLTSSSPPYTSFPLLCTDELPIPTDQLAAKGVSFALVDHNRLLTQFVPKATTEEEEGDPSKGPVVAILDHHEDEGLYISSSPPCDPRIIDRNAGSASSLVTNYFASFLSSSSSSSGIPPPTSPHFPIPKELATLLISSVLIDTGGLKPNGKAHPLDHQAISFLYPISTFAHPTPSSPSSISPDEEQALTASYTQGDAIPSPLTELASSLLTVKKDVSHLPTASLLARDYKQYTFLSPLSPSSSSTSNDNGNAPRPIHLGLATVPLGLSDWLARPTQNGEEAWGAFREELETFCSTHGLEVLGVLTTYRSSKDKHRREILLYMPSHSSSSSSSSPASPSVYNALVSGLSSHPDLSCQDWKDGSNVLPEGGAEVVWGKGAKGKIWRQGNADATRKVVAPAFKAILEGGEEKKEVGRGRGGAFR